MKKELRKKGIKQAKKVESQPQMIRFGDLKKQVFNSKGEHLGQIEDIILDLTNKRISFGILSFGGIFGLGETRYAIPWEMLKYEEKDGKFLLDIDKEKLTGAESFDPEKYPFYGPWAVGLYGYWRYIPYWPITNHKKEIKKRKKSRGK